MSVTISPERQTELLAADYSKAPTIDDLYGTLSVAEIKLLYNQSPGFKAKVDEFNAAEQAAVVPPAPVLTPEEQAQKDAEAAAQAQAEADAAAAAQAEADRLAAEAEAANKPPEPPAPPVPPVAPVETLYDGVEKLADGRYKLIVDPEDGTPPEVFFGQTQADCFKALRKSKAQATKELRRRKKSVQITNDLKALEVEKINYAPLTKPLVLTPDEIFELTEQLKDPVTVLAATRKLRQASMTQEECDRANAAEIQRRYIEQRDTAFEWIGQHPEFYNCPENIAAIQKLMGELNWAVTLKNLDRAFKELQTQGVLLDEPEVQAPVQPAVQPASVVPVPAVPASPSAPAPAAAAPSVTAPAAPASALPAPVKVLRPGSSSTAAMPTRRIESVNVAPRQVVLTVEEYHRIPATVMKQRYNREPEFKAAVDALIASGKI